MADLNPPTYEKTVASTNETTNEIGSGQTSQAGDAISTAPPDVTHPPANVLPATTTAQEPKKSTITSTAVSESIFPARAPLQTHKDYSLKENYAIDLPNKAVGTQNDVDFKSDWGNIQTKLYLSGRTSGVVRVGLLACRGSVDLALHMDLSPPDLSLRLNCTALKGNTVLLPDHFRGTISFSSALDISCLSPILRQTIVYCPHPEGTRKDLKLITVEGARKTKIALLGESSQQEVRQEVKPAVQESQCCCIS